MTTGGIPPQMNPNKPAYIHTVAHENSLNTAYAYLDLDILFSPEELSMVFPTERRKLHSWHIELLHLETLCSQFHADISALSIDRWRQDMQQMEPSILNKHGGEEMNMRAEIITRKFWVKMWRREIDKLQIKANAVVARMQMQKEAKMHKQSYVRMELQKKFKEMSLEEPTEMILRFP